MPGDELAPLAAQVFSCGWQSFLMMALLFYVISLVQKFVSHSSAIPVNVILTCSSSACLHLK
jgi:hypothetical protein